MSRFARRKDGNHAAIAKRLVELGCSVRDNSRNGDGGPDITVGLLGRDYQIEIKQPGRGLEAHQQEWHDAWRGQRPIVLWEISQAEAWVANMRRRLFDEAATI